MMECLNFTLLLMGSKCVQLQNRSPLVLFYYYYYYLPCPWWLSISTSTDSLSKPREKTAPVHWQSCLIKTSSCSWLEWLGLQMWNSAMSFWGALGCIRWELLCLSLLQNQCCTLFPGHLHLHLWWQGPDFSYCHKQEEMFCCATVQLLLFREEKKSLTSRGSDGEGMIGMKAS